jgi:putative ABC transport system substrate-binding protein
MSEDLVGEGFAASLAKPGSNVTGVSLLSPELDGKRLEILIEAVPGAHQIAALAHSAIATELHLAEQRALARSGGVELSIVPFAGAEDIASAFDEAKARGAQARTKLSAATSSWITCRRLGCRRSINGRKRRN